MLIIIEEESFLLLCFLDCLFQGVTILDQLLLLGG